jgi:D-sedoheptulose 7-phosphate isomerase
MEQIKKIIQSSIDVKTAVLENSHLLKTILTITEVMVAALKSDRRIYFCGNGGSAADAQHLAAELTGRFYTDRKALAAEALHCNTSYLTAVANDYGFDEIYARMIEGIAQEGDVLVGLSTSGNSKNIINAFEKAKEQNVITVSFTGETGGALKPLSNYCINIPSSDTPRIQETHILIGHIICQLVEEKYFMQ